MKYDIFISYRRRGGYETAKHLYDLLSRDGYKVSFDIDTLRSGDFDTELLKRIDECNDFILVVDPHAFDKVFDKDTPANSDWLRCELAYALKKNKNIIPVFLSGISSFPANLPPDISSVITKNGPQYNKYYFDSFYEKLKADFLSTKAPSNRLTTIRIIGLSLFVFLLGIGIYRSIPDRNENKDEEQSNSISVTELNSTMSSSRAIAVVSDVIRRRPILAYGFEDNGRTKIAALINENEFEGDEPGRMIAMSPDPRLVLISNEAGVWDIELDQHLDVNCFYKKLDYSGNHQPYEEFEDEFFLFHFKEDSRVFKVDENMYFFFGDSRSYGGNATADIIHEYVAINLSNLAFHTIRYLEISDSRSDNGMLLLSNTYPTGIKDYLLGKFETDTTVKKADGIVLSHNPDHAVKDWFLDNPNCSGYLDSLDYGEKHTLFVRRYERMPFLEDYEENEDMFKVYTIGNYKVYSRWRGDVFALDERTDEYFLVWTDLLHYNTKFIEDAGDNWIRLVYGEQSLDNKTTNAVIYNLDTHTYYYSRVNFSYEKYNSW